MAVTKTDGVALATPGQSLTYTIVVSNDGPSTDPAATLTDTFPADLTCTFTSVAAGGATGNTASGSGNLAETLNLLVGSSVTYTVSCTTAAAMGTLSNTATVTSSVPDPVTANNSATDSGTVLAPQTDLAIVKDDVGATFVPGTTITYTLTVTNNGPSDSTGGTITDVLPTGLTFVSSASGCTVVGSTVTCMVPALAYGASVALTFIVMVDAGQTAAITNTATVAGNETDPTAGNDSASHMTPLASAETDLSISKDDGVTSVAFGTTLTYAVIVTNNGPSAAPGVSVTDPFPATFTGCSFTSTAAGGATGNTMGAGNPSDTLTMPAGSAVTYTVTCTAAEATGTVSNTATVSSAVTDPVPDNNSATDSDTLTVAPTTTTVAGQTATFTAAAQDVVLTATVTGSVVDEGTVTFQVKDGTINIGTAVTSAPVSNSMASVEGPGTFFFTTGGTGLADFSLVDDGNGTNIQTFSSLAPGTFTITEIVPTEWKLDTVVCASSGTGTSAVADKDTGQGTITLAAGGTVACTFTNVLGIPTLPQWGMMLLTLSLLSLATWQLAGQAVGVGAGANGAGALLSPRSHWLTSLLLGQGVVTLGLGLYAFLIGPLVPHDGLGAFLAGVLLSVMVEGYRRTR